jgi:hypothetical protein
MTTKTHHLAQINIARARAPLDDPAMADFVARLDEVNAAAEGAPGFIWRLKAEDGGGSSYINAFDDERMLINMTVWESVEALHEYVYRHLQHREVLRARARWFEPLGSPSVALWWVPAGHVPTIEEGKARLELLARLGPTPEAFTFKERFPPADQRISRRAAE